MHPAIFFDLDGTLTDPKPGITACIRYALRQLDQPLALDADLDWCIGPPLQGSFAKLLADARQVPRAMELYRERFVERGMFENEVYPGIGPLLSVLFGSTRLWVATSKPRVFAETIVEHFGLAGYFQGVYGSELDGQRSDKAELLAFLLKREQIAPATAAMVGDREQDILGAKKNGLSAYGVLWGYGSEAELSDAGADGLDSTPAQLQARLLGELV